jgi:hypothetical protein
LLQQNKERIVLIKIIFAWQHATYTFAMHGDLAQLVERLHGMQEVTGSTPVFSTIFFKGTFGNGGFFVVISV